MFGAGKGLGLGLVFYFGDLEFRSCGGETEDGFAFSLDNSWRLRLARRESFDPLCVFFFALRTYIRHPQLVVGRVSELEGGR